MIKSARDIRQFRSMASQFETRESDSGEKIIEGYFAVFNSVYPLWPGAHETVLPGAFTDTLGGDIRALINHDTTLVLGRTKAGTLELLEDEHGLWGRIIINPEDGDAMNLYTRVQRGDVDQCSFGFDIISEGTVEEGGETVWQIKAVTLYEVSVVTFPAYEETAVEARKADFANIQKRKLQEWQQKTKTKLRGKGKQNGN